MAPVTPQQLPPHDDPDNAYRPALDWSAHKTILTAILIVIAALIAPSFVINLFMTPDDLRDGGLTTPSAQVGLMLILHAALIAGTLLAVRFNGTPLRSALALGPPRGGARDYLVALLMLAAAIFIISVVLVYGLGHDPRPDLKLIADLLRSPAGGMMLFIAAIAAPLAEELLFRGMMQAGLTRSPIGFWGGALVATTLWTGMHMGGTMLGLVVIFLMGMLFSWFLKRTGSLRVPMLCHGVYNGVLSFGILGGHIPV